MHKDFSDDAWADYTYWIMQDKKTLKKINQLLSDIERNGNEIIRLSVLYSSFNRTIKLCSKLFLSKTPSGSF